MHPCDKCTLIQDEVYKRLLGYGYSEIDTHPDWAEEVIWDICESCWCDKVGTRIFYSSGCEKYYHKIANRTTRSRQKKSTKRSRYEKHQNKLKHLNDMCRGYPSPVWYKDEIFILGQGYTKNPKPYYVRCYREKGSSYHKRRSNRKIRHYKGDIKNGCWCHKLYDFWWEMY